GISGIMIYLTGTTTSPVTTVNQTATTDPNGAFSFVNPPAGTYHLQADPVPQLVSGHASIGDVMAPAGVTVSVVGNVTPPPASNGLLPQFFCMNEFLTDTGVNDYRSEE